MAAFAFVSAISAGAQVASLDLCADEYLLMFARNEQVAAVSRLSKDPAESPFWKRARTFPSFGGRAETLLPLHPDVLLSVGFAGGRSTQVFAKRLGWRSIVLPYPASPDEVAENVRIVAALLGAGAKEKDWRERFVALRRDAPRSSATMFVSGGGLTVDAEGLSAQWMRLAGFRQLPVPGGKITLERMALHPPATLLLSDYRSGQISLGQRWLQHPIVRSAPSRKVRTDGRPWTCAGPLMLDEIARLKAHG